MKNLQDWIGISSATLCLLHCLLAPLMMIALKASAEFIRTVEFLNYIFLLVSFWSVFRVSQKQLPAYLLTILWGSFGGIVVSIVFESEFSWLSYLNYTSAVGLITGHLLHIRHCQYCQKSNLKKYECIR